MTTVSRTVDSQPLQPEALATYLRERLEDRMLTPVIAYRQLTVNVVPDAVPAAVQLCRDDPQLAFDFFDFLCGVDDRDNGFAVVTHLYSTRHRHHIQIRALAAGGREDPHVPTISHLYAGANWHERETYDMFGITFDGHPGLLPRILTVENFEGFPLRKEFLLMTREVKPWPGLKEPMEAASPEAEPREAADIAATAIAKDAAAGAVGGDTAAGAPGDQPGVDEPVEDLAREAEIAGGGPPRPSGTPGVEAEGRHVGAREQAGDRPAAETPGMTSDTQADEAARDPDETPAPPPDDQQDGQA